MVAFEAASVQNLSLTTSATAYNLPQTTALDDFIIVTITGPASNAAISTVGGGGTWVEEPVTAESPTVMVWYGYGLPAGVTQININTNISANSVVIMAMFSGIYSSRSPYVGASFASGTTWPFTSSGIGYTPGDLVVGIYAIDGDSTAPTVTWGNGNANNNVKFQYWSNPGAGASLDYIIPSSGTGTSVTYSGSGTDEGTVGIICFASVANPPPTPATYPIESTTPSGYVNVASTSRDLDVFYVDETSRVLNVFTIASSAKSPTTTTFTGAYFVRDYYGTLIYEGRCSAANTISIPDGLACGYYDVFGFTPGQSDSVYGPAAFHSGFIIVNDDSRFPSFVGHGAQGPNDHYQYGDAVSVHGITMQGPTRMECSDPTNSAYLTDIEGTIGLHNLWYTNPSYLDPERPRPLIATLVSAEQSETIGLTSPSTAATDWANMVATLAASPYDVVWFEGPCNEPNYVYNAAGTATALQTFSTVTKGAASGVKVMGPSPVSFNNSIDEQGTGYWHNFLQDLAAMDPVPIDGISFHGYNCYVGDLGLMQDCWALLNNAIADAGFEDLPLFHTEQGFFATNIGVFEPRKQAQWTMLMLLYQEQMGLPKEHHIIFFDSDTSDYGFPSFYNQSWSFAAVPMIRAFSAEVWGCPPTPTALNFGTPGNWMALGSVYTNASTGNQVVALISNGATDLNVRFTVTGGTTSFTLVDAFGNTSTLTTEGNILVVPITVEPCYVRVPSGTTLTLIQDWDETATLGPELLGTYGTASSSGSSGNQTYCAKVIGGYYSSTWFNNNAATRSTAGCPYIDDTGTFPSWFEVQLSPAQTLDTIFIWCPTPWQSEGTLLDAEVQYWNGSAWVSAHHIVTQAVGGTAENPNATVVAHPSSQYQTGCGATSYFSNRHQFFVRLPSKVTTSAIRIYVHNATYGNDPNLTAFNCRPSGNQGLYQNNFALKNVWAYNSKEPTLEPLFV